MTALSPKKRAIIIGGGFYGCSVALIAKQMGLHPLILETSDDLLGRASATNQARIHGGYHYPRSLMTAVRSRANYHRFRSEYESCVVDRFTKIYAVGRAFSKVTAGQFALFMHRIGAPLRRAPEKIRRLGLDSSDTTVEIPELPFRKYFLMTHFDLPSDSIQHHPKFYFVIESTADTEELQTYMGYYYAKIRGQLPDYLRSIISLKSVPSL